MHIPSTIPRICCTLSLVFFPLLALFENLMFICGFGLIYIAVLFAGLHIYIAGWVSATFQAQFTRFHWPERQFEFYAPQRFDR